MRFTSVAYDAIVPRNDVARARHVDDPRADEAAGERLRDAERPAAARAAARALRDSIVSSSTPNTRSPRIAPQLLLLGLDQRARLGLGRALRGDAHDEALDPAGEERDRRVAVASSASSRCATISASADSDVPHVFSDRDTIVDASPRASRRSGITCSRDHLLHLVRHARHRVDDLAVADRAAPDPGAVPIGFGIASPPSGMSAWRRLFAGMSRSRGAEHRRDLLGELHAAHERHAHQLGDRVACQVVLGRAEPAADEHRVGARRAGRAARRRSAPGCRRPRGARSESMPDAASCSPIHALFVSTICPSSSSVPIASTSHRTTARLLAGRSVRSLAAGSRSSRAGRSPARRRR